MVTVAPTMPKLGERFETVGMAALFVVRAKHASKVHKVADAIRRIVRALIGSLRFLKAPWRRLAFERSLAHKLKAVRANRIYLQNPKSVPVTTCKPDSFKAYLYPSVLEFTVRRLT